MKVRIVTENGKVLKERKVKDEVISHSDDGVEMRKVDVMDLFSALYGR